MHPGHAINKANRERELMGEIDRLKKQKSITNGYCGRKHAFCPDCRDKLPDDFCWRCETQRLQAEIAKRDKTIERMRDALMAIEASGPICSHTCLLADARIIAEFALRGDGD